MATKATLIDEIMGTLKKKSKTELIGISGKLQIKKKKKK